MTIIAVTGKRGCGKDTFADYLKKSHGFSILNFSGDALYPELKKRGFEITRENLIRVGMELREREGNDVLAKIIAEKIENGSDYCISGMRFSEELDYMKSKFGSGFFLVAIVCDAEKRYERILKRGDRGEANLTFEEFEEIDNRPTEKAIDELMERADIVIDNNGTIEEFHENIEKLYSSVLKNARREN